MVLRPSRRLALAALCGSVLLAAGCGTNTGGASSDAAASGSSSSSAPQTLTVWFPGNSAPEVDLVTKTLVPEFEKANNAKVQVTYVDWGQISPKLNAAFAGNTAPDVFGHGPAAAAGFAKADRIATLDDDIAAMPADARQDLSPYLDGGKVDGKQYLVPLGGTGVLVAYRKDLFQAAGLDPASPPTTWDQALQDAEKLTVRKNGQVAQAGLLLQSAAIQRVQTYTALLGSYGGSLLTPDGKKSAWNSPEGAKALQYFVDLYRGGNPVSNQLGADFANAPAGQNPLATGKAAMVLATSSQVANIVKARPDLADKIGVLGPLSASTAKAFGGPGPGLFINKDSKNKDLAWKFIEFMVSKNVTDRYAQAAGLLPALASSASGSYVQQNPLMKEFIQAAPAYLGSPNVPAWVQVRDVLDKHLEQALNGKVSAAQALSDAASEADPLLAAQ
ncbi:MAG: ABC transporter substrate-binding protein [Motilibacteraceae bacterium]